MHHKLDISKLNNIIINWLPLVSLKGLNLKTNSTMYRLVASRLSGIKRIN